MGFYFFCQYVIVHNNRPGNKLKEKIDQMEDAKQNEIYERIIRNMIDNSREEMLRNDEEYLRLEAARTNLEDKYLEDDKYKAAMNLLEQYIDFVQEVDMRFADVSYMAGVKDTIMLMAKLGIYE